MQSSHKLFPTYSDYYQIVKSETSVYSSINCIVDKVEEDSNLKLIGDVFKQIFEREIVYAIVGRVIRT